MPSSKNVDEAWSLSILLPEVTDAVLTLQARFKTGERREDVYNGDSSRGGKTTIESRLPTTDASIRFSTRSTRAASMMPGTGGMGAIRPPSVPKPAERTRVPENVRLETHELEHATVALYSIVLMMNESQRSHYFNAVITENAEQRKFLSKLLRVCANCLLGSPGQDPNLFNR